MSKRTLLLLRHAKSSWDDPRLEDRERPLAARGRRAARALGVRLRRRDVRIDRVLCSPAQRTRETLALLGLPKKTPVRFEERLYLASVQTLLARIRRLGREDHCVLVIGHDPGFEQLARRLVGDGRRKATGRLTKGFPTGALATLRVPGGWSSLEPGCAFLEDFTRPKDS